MSEADHSLTEKGKRGVFLLRNNASGRLESVQYAACGGEETGQCTAALQQQGTVYNSMMRTGISAQLGNLNSFLTVLLWVEDCPM